MHKGNIFRVFFSGTAIMVMTIWIANQMVELQTELARNTELLGNATQVSSLDQAGSPITYLLAKAGAGELPIGWFVILALYGAAFIYTYVKYRRGTLYVEQPEPAPEAAR